MTMLRAAFAFRRRHSYAAVLVVAILGAVPPRAESCRSAIGDRRAARLVERCVAVSPATRPPCNADNACALIESEIVRGCRMLDADAPAFCREDGR